MSLKHDAKVDEQLRSTRSALDNALRQLEKARVTKDELVQAVYDASRTAVAALDIPKVPRPAKDSRRKSPESTVAVVSDWQLGKRTPDYDSASCERRIARFADKVERIVAVQRADHPITECHVFALGDIIEGELIFPGQAHRIDSSLYRQVTVDGPRIMASFIRRMLAIHDKVVVWWVDGNHGALGGPWRKEYHPESNGDRMLGRIVQLILEQEIAAGRVEFKMLDPDGERNWYHVAHIGNYRSMLIHGDQFRGHAGMPWYSLQKKVGGWSLGAIGDFIVDERPGHSDIDFGHWHQPTRVTLNRVTARCNGSTESYNTFAIEQLAAVGQPSQGLRFVDPERGRVTGEYTVWLDAV